MINTLLMKPEQHCLLCPWLVQENPALFHVLNSVCKRPKLDSLYTLQIFKRFATAKSLQKIHKLAIAVVDDFE